ncbi:hypothetical protein GOBAR_AA16773 [Gossypium barbadense]|uniref:Uncharacterized protein n=1 Tax=Gossypium barbadense TaxID=3634 RepID=A0A2P5XKJ9_GOSBA|nr:hypothetical protein GOBAR_AA16773 [Gossypium barbadense]
MGHTRVPSFQPVHFVVFEIGRIGVLGHVARSCQSSFASPTPVFAHGHVARSWQLIASRVGKKFLPCFYTTVSHGRVASRDMCMAYGTHGGC